MQVSKRKPITEMRQTALARTIAPKVEQIAKELNTPSDIVDIALWRFIQLSARVEFAKGEVDFSLPLATDDAEGIAAKFVKYAASECQDVIDEAFRAMTALDAPSDPVTAPNPPKDDDAGN